MIAHEREFAKRFAERKEQQLNSGQCAAQIVDCDCDWCIRQDVEREMLDWREMPDGE